MTTLDKVSPVVLESLEFDLKCQAVEDPDDNTATHIFIMNCPHHVLYCMDHTMEMIEMLGRFQNVGCRECDTWTPSHEAQMIPLNK